MQLFQQFSAEMFCGVCEVVESVNGGWIILTICQWVLIEYEKVLVKVQKHLRVSFIVMKSKFFESED